MIKKEKKKTKKQLSAQKRAQLQMGESIMVMIILVILGVIAMVFYTGYSKEKYEIKFKEYEELNALETAQTVSNMYELRCAKTGVTDLCFDIHKVQAFIKLTGRETESEEQEDDDDGENNDQPEQIVPRSYTQAYYQDMFKNSKVTLIQIYPKINEENPEEPQFKEYVLYENNAATEQTSKRIDVPVPIYDSALNELTFGVLRIERYFRIR